MLLYLLSPVLWLELYFLSFMHDHTQGCAKETKRREGQQDKSWRCILLYSFFKLHTNNMVCLFCSLLVINPFGLPARQSHHPSYHPWSPTLHRSYHVNSIALLYHIKHMSCTRTCNLIMPHHYARSFTLIHKSLFVITINTITTLTHLKSLIKPSPI